MRPGEQFQPRANTKKIGQGVYALADLVTTLGMRERGSLLLLLRQILNDRIEISRARDEAGWHHWRETGGYEC